MRIFTAGNSNMTLQVEQGGTIYEVEARDTIILTREMNKPATLTAEVIRNSMGGGYFTPEIGDMVSFSINSSDPDFVGYILETDKHDRDWCSITAYDQLWYMAQNQHDWVFEDMTATEIVKELCSMWEFAQDDSAVLRDSQYKIESLVCEGVSLLDSIQQAIDLTYENTGNEFFIWDNSWNICFGDNPYMSGLPKIEVTPDMIREYSLTETALSDFYTAVVLTGSSGAKSALTEEQRNPSWLDDDEKEPGINDPDYKDEKTKKTSVKYPVMTIADSGLTEDQLHPPWVEYDEAGDSGDTSEAYGVTAADEVVDRYGLIIYYGDVEEDEDVQSKAKQILYNYADPKLTLSVTGAIGDPSVRGGSAIVVNFWDADKMEDVRGWFTVESVTHNITAGSYTMDMELRKFREYSDYDKSILSDGSRKNRYDDVVTQDADWLTGTVTVGPDGVKDEEDEN